MRRPLHTIALLALMSICFITHGKMPRLPELRGAELHEAAQRSGGDRAERA